MAKHTLNTSSDDLDFLAIGLACPENQYAVLSLVNDSLKIELQLSEYVPFNLKEGRIFRFSLYHFSDVELGIDYFFVPNSSNFEDPKANIPGSNDLFKDVDVDESVKLIKELPKTDYFLILKGEEVQPYQFRIMDRLKHVERFLQVQWIDLSDLPNRRNLIF